MLDLPISEEVVLISDRENFWDTNKISDFTYMMSVSPIDFSYFAGKKVLFLVHGYNNTTEDAVKSYKIVSEKMHALKHSDGTQIYDLIVNYFWPGYQNIDAYLDAKDNAQSPLLTHRFVDTLSRVNEKATSIDVIAHSMGNRLLLEALEHTSHPTPLVRNFYSFAAAIDYDSVYQDGQYGTAIKLCKNVYVFHSDVDIALKGYKEIEQNDSLGADENIDVKRYPKNIQFVDCTLLIEGDHSGYFTSKADPIYQFIADQQTKGDLAPVPKEWTLQQDGTLKEGDVVLDPLQRIKDLTVAAVHRVAE